jgi:hypothetical protein
MQTETRQHSGVQTGSLWWSVAVVGYSGLVLAYVGLWLNQARHDEFWKADFSAFYTGWTMVLNGEGSQLYDRDRQLAYQRQHVPRRGDHLLPFLNPPHSALPFAGLALLPRRVAFYVWTGLQLLLLLPLGLFLRRLALPRTPGEQALLLVGVLAFPPMLMTFQLGQVSLLLTVSLLGFYDALLRKDDAGAAVWLVLGTIKPQLVVIPAVTLLALRRWRAVLLAGGLFALWALVTTAILGGEVWLGFLRMMQHTSQQFDARSTVDPLQMVNLKGFLTALLGTQRAGLVNLLSLLALALAMLTTFWLWWGSGEPGSARSWLLAALTAMLGLLCNPHFNPADTLTLVVPGLLFLGYCRRCQLPERSLVTVLLFCPLFYLIDRFAVTSWPGNVRPFFLLMVAITLWMAWTCRQQVRGPRSEAGGLLTSDR